MRVWIDADGCPAPAREVVLQAARKRRFPLTFVADRPLVLPRLDWIDAVQVRSGADAADAWIAEHAVPGDLVVTQDIPLAAIVVEKGVTAISPRGETFTRDNVRERLSVRDFLSDVRATGVVTGGPPPYDQRARLAFANALDRWLTLALRRAGGGG